VRRDFTANRLQQRRLLSRATSEGFIQSLLSLTLPAVFANNEIHSAPFSPSRTCQPGDGCLGHSRGLVLKRNVAYGVRLSTCVQRICVPRYVLTGRPSGVLAAWLWLGYHCRNLGNGQRHTDRPVPFPDSAGAQYSVQSVCL
jgi:hypothetical protein